MSAAAPPPPPVHGEGTPGTRTEAPLPAPGQSGLVSFGLAIGVLLMAVQLWLLTLALNLYLLGDRRGTVYATVISGLIFAGGLIMLRVLRRTAHPR
ncbi:MAG TPA: DUF6755 family protein [Gemmatimonadaceae bacterium]|nr:DUF6755 family protein [Gemmatimonadaceae bacterium]